MKTRFRTFNRGREGKKEMKEMENVDDRKLRKK